MKIDVVLGTFFGDEGKGLATDYLSDKSSCVVRFSGGAQAGHTVLTPNGTRHVFHHIGSGTFRGAATYLSEHFAVDPVLFNREFEELRPKCGVEKVRPPYVIVDPMAPVVTPYDVLLNQLTEQARGSGRHGSCGAGIGEAMKRHEERPERLLVRDLDCPYLEAKLDAIEGYVRREAGQRRVISIEERFEADLARCREMFTEAVKPFLWRIRAGRIGRTEFDHLVFEGSQGVMLDRDIGVFPHVTRAKTSLRNVEEILRRMGLTGQQHLADVYFMHRAYITRHGAGPLIGETTSEELGLINYADQTNVPNPWQGTLRYAPLDYTLLGWVMTTACREVDFNYCPHRFATCVDQIGPNGVKLADGSVVSKDTFKWDIYSEGPTRDHVRHGGMR